MSNPPNIPANSPVAYPNFQNNMNYFMRQFGQNTPGAPGAAPGIADPGFPNRGFPNQGFPNPGFPNQGFPNRGFPIPGRTPCNNPKCSVCVKLGGPCAKPCPKPCPKPCISTCAPPCAVAQPVSVPVQVPVPVPIPICPIRPCIPVWKVQNLDSNLANASLYYDAELINAWGIAIAGSTIYMVSNNNDSIQVYDMTGNLLTSISARNSTRDSAFPTGIVINTTGGFLVTTGNLSLPAVFLNCTEAGTINAYNPAVNPTNAIVVAAVTRSNASYKGMTLANNYLYAADFNSNTVDVYDQNFNLLVGFPFVDGYTVNPIPSTFACFNVVYLGGYIYVLYAQKNAAVHVNPIPGPGNGYISVFNTDGTFVKRLVSRGELNTPWGMIPAPCGAGYPENSFFIGNNGDGFINIYDSCGKYHGKLISPAQIPIQIPELWGLCPNYRCGNEIYFGSGPNNETNGIFGIMTRDNVC